MALINKEMGYKEMAEIIFNEFEINQSCKVEGVLTDSGRLVEKGRAVLDHIAWMDEVTNTYNGKRKRTKVKDAVGGDIAHKIFRYARRIANDEIRYTIWRMQ